MTMPGVNGTWLGRGDGSDGDENKLGVQLSVLIAANDVERVRIDEGGGAEHQGDAVAFHLAADDFHLGAHDMVGAVEEVGHVDVVLDGIAGAVDGAFAQSGEMKDRFANGF